MSKKKEVLVPSLRGLLLVVIGLALLAAETYFLIYLPASNATFTMTKGQFWALAIPTYVIVLMIVGTTIWIGYTMITTPEPIRLTYEEAYEAAIRVDDDNGEET